MNVSNFTLEQFARRYGRHYVQHASLPDNVLSGECHGDEHDVKPQIAFIETFRPAVVLHEFLGIDVYDPSTKSWSKRREESDRTAPYDEDGRQVIVDLFKELADDYGFLLVGCDLTLGERAYLVDARGGEYQSDEAIRSKRHQMGLPVNGLLGVSYLDLVDPERHQEMAEVYQQHRNNPGGLLMITGLHHVRGENPPDWQKSDLHDLLSPADYGVMEHRQNVKHKLRELVLV